jgi:hypothetical protein
VRVRPHKMSGRCLACFRVGQVWVAARSDAACVRSRAGLDSMESEAGAATSHHAATTEPESTAAETAAPESPAADEDGATYMGVLQCRFGGRAWIEPSDGGLGGRGRWGLGKQAHPRAQLFASCVTGEGATKRRHDKATGHRHARDGSRGDSQVCVECLC